MLLTALIKMKSAPNGNINFNTLIVDILSIPYSVAYQHLMNIDVIQAASTEISSLKFVVSM